MRVPILWLKDYIDTDKSTKEIADIFTSIGLMLEKPIENDILELEHRFDRSDWLSIVGCARDLSAVENRELKLPKLYKDKGALNGGVKISVECPELVNRFNTRVFRGIKVGPSPKWMVERLEAYGMPSINNIVDITNFVMIELGQPLHAQDLSKFSVREIVIRNAKQNEEITTLDGTLLKLDEDTFILAQNNIPIAIGGVVGSKLTAVNNLTVDIILDAGNYNQASVRKAARKYKIRNETVVRSDKFLHPESTQTALERATGLILELAGGEYYENFDYYPNKKQPQICVLRSDRIKQLSALSIEEKKVKQILTSLSYKILVEEDGMYKVEVPYFRTDFSVEDDIVSDILRIYGFENIPFASMASAPPEEITPPIYYLKEKIRDAFVSLGLHEHITDSLVKHDMNNINQVRLENSLNSEQNALRTTIYETLLKTLSTYLKHGIDEVGIFEIGKIYSGNGYSLDDYKETTIAEVIYKSGKGFYNDNKELKSILAGFFHLMNIENISYKKVEDKAKIYQDSLLLGELKTDSFFIYVENLLKTTKTGSFVQDEFENHIIKDISLILDVNLSAGKIYEYIRSYDPSVKNVEVIEEYVNKKLGKDKKSITLRIHSDRQVVEDITKIIEEKFNVRVRR